MTENKKHSLKLANIIAYALLGALAFVIMLFEIPLPITSFLKFDFSDVIIAIGTFLFGAGPGAFIALIRMALHLIYHGFALPSIVGQVAAFLASISFAFPFYFMTKNIKKDATTAKKHLYPLLGIIIGILAMTVVLATLNALVLTPMYAVTSIPNAPAIHSYPGLLNFTEKVYLAKLLHIPSMGTYIFSFIVPFNLVKGAINGVVVYILFETVLKSIKPFVEKHF
ncbi:ECF transporter S component [Lactobacillus sp. ESL0791]|uniref:ECF transporter S component n=1 Tax=Lactobacillus sp. ESL0791 TaxID=2983234 RepID=UPI0023F89F3D|nr:ECF transporter S component [Lactobacillus sp. ESL0791]MDF7638871.1 ECF transporter S component [Lactobacillus sp. ESL0791]